MATFRERNGKIQAAVYIDGKRTSKTFDNKKEAELWALQTEVDGIVADDQDRLSAPTMQDVMQKYIDEVLIHSRASYGNINGAKFLMQPAWTNRKLSDVDTTVLSAWRDEQYKRVKPKTVQTYFNTYKTAINYYFGKFHPDTPNNVFRKVKLKKAFARDVQRITDADLNRIRENYAPLSGLGLGCLIDFAVETAIRKGEMLKLEWSMVDLDKGWLNLPDRITKTSMPRRIPLSVKAEDALMRWKAMDDEGVAVHRTAKFFKTEDGQKRVFKVGYAQLEEMWKKAKRNAGMDYLHWHDLRHEATSRLFDKGCTVTEAQSITGHATLEELTRYSHASGASVHSKIRGGGSND